MLEHHARVRADHARLVHHAGQSPDRIDGAWLTAREVEPVEPHGVVAREEAAIVFEHGEPEPLDLGVGGIDVGAVDLTARERGVG